MLEKPFNINTNNAIKIGSNGIVDVGCDIKESKLFLRRGIDSTNKKNIEMLVVEFDKLKIYVRQPNNDQVKVFISTQDLYGI
jgi:hypothetical protein